MAPPNGNMKTRRPGGSKLAQSSKPVIPAIPLPHVKRQAATAAARASTASSTTTQEPDALSPPASKLTNGHAPAEVKKGDKADKAASISSSPASTAANTGTKTDDHQETNNSASDPANAQDSSGMYYRCPDLCHQVL
jgi:hypothetical protein